MDRYVRVRKIGEGSFGKALLVKKKNDGKHCVIKEINISKMKPREREESRKEVKVLSQLKHPNIVTYMESFEETGNLYIVMDYCDGGDLYKKINGQRGVPFNEEQVMDWFVQIALGIKHVHDRKILHRDIKSQNIFLTRHGIVKLGDFGIARVLHSTVELARTCIGTPYYLSPEIIENRPYNNKSDIWSLGCVLYEMLTLKHAFEAGNMKNLVLKIIRGSYPPIPLRYSADVRLLVSQLLKRNPRDRPSANTVLKKSFIQKRIQKFLSEEVIQDEFSHTVLHRKPFGVQGQRPLPSKPAPAKPVAAAPKFSKPEAKYSVSVAKKKPPRKPSSGGEPARKAVRDHDAVKLADKRKEMDARERRRKELMNQQDQMYNEHMKKIQQQRWERQQREHINKAREQAWKSTMSVGLSPEKQADHAVAAKQAVVNKDPQPMHKYQRPVSAQERKENIPEVPKPSRPVSAISANNVPPHPTPAWEAARQGQINREYGAEAAERARIKEEFWARKRAAAQNKLRGRADYGGYEYRPPVQPKAVGGNGDKNGNKNGGIKGRNNEEQDYLARLEAIRRQNYAERRELQRRMAGIRGPPQAAPSQKEEVKGDPRYDPEARKKKIAALKQQAEERAALLRKQLDEKKKAVLERLNKAGKEKWEEEQKKIKEKPINADERRIQPAKRAVPDERPVAAAVGLETALKQVGVKTLFRSNSENDISKVCNENDNSEEPDVNQHPRKKWGAIPFQPRILPLEVTASHMEATSAQDAVIKPGDENGPARRHWGQQKTQIVSALEKIKLQTATSAIGTMGGNDQNDAAVKNDKTSAVPKPFSPSAGIGQTITIQKQHVETPGSPIGQTVTVSQPSPPIGNPVTGSPATPNTVILKNRSHEETIPHIEEGKGAPASPVKAWGEKPATPSKDYSVAKIPFSPKPNSRQAYDQFVKSARSEEKKTEQPAADDLKIEDVSVEDSSFHTADGSPEKSSYTVMLKTGNFDTNSKRLRTCSMPDLRLLFTTPGKNPYFQRDEDHNDNDNGDQLDQKDDATSNAEEKVEQVAEDDGGNGEDDGGDDEDDGGGDDDSAGDNDSAGDEEDDGEDFGDDDEEDELAGESDEEEEAKEYENMLASMRDVLVSSARSPSPLKTAATVQSMDWDPSGDTAAPIADDTDGTKGTDQTGRSSELSNLNEDWDSGDGEDEDEDIEDEQKEQEDDSVFQRLEESRLALEQELGFDRFLRVYRYLQSVQENDDENANVGSSDEITELLGDKEHLYPKILYLVIADSAYNEDNQ